MEEEREKRLDPDNRPDGAEIDNTERTFDVDRGQFTDSEDYDDSEPAPFADPEDPNQNDDDSDDSEDDSDDDDSDEDSDDSDEDRQGRGVQLKVLLTGSAGSIGTVLQPRLAALGHDVVGADLPGRGGDLDLDCTDHVAVDAAVEQVGPDAIIHLAGISTESSLPDALVSHVVSTGALLEAMVRHDVRRIVYASSNHAVGREPRSELLDTDVRGRPDTFYGVGKVAAEALLQLFVDRHGIDVVSTRIGTVRGPTDDPAAARQLALARRRRADVRGRADRARTRLRRRLRHLRQHPRLVGPRAGQGARLRPAGRRRAVRRRDRGRARDGGRPRRGGPRRRPLRHPRGRAPGLRLSHERPA